VPGVNGVIDNSTNEMVYRDYADISIAVATPKGLVTPVLRDCQVTDCPARWPPVPPPGQAGHGVADGTGGWARVGRRAWVC
jgi:hypothetical protein